MPCVYSPSCLGGKKDHLNLRVPRQHSDAFSQETIALVANFQSQHWKQYYKVLIEVELVELFLMKFKLK